MARIAFPCWSNGGWLKRFGHDKSLIIFGNVEVPAGEMNEECLAQQDLRFNAVDTPTQNRNILRLPFETIIGRHGACFADGRYLTKPLNGIYISNFSLHYLGMFMLSSLIRYRPQTWFHAITRNGYVEKIG